MSNKPKRHCMIVHAYYPLGETRVQRQAEALLDAGIEVDIICLRSPSRESATEVINGANIYRLPVQRGLRERGFTAQFQEYAAFAWLAKRQLARLYPVRQYDIVQIHNLPDFLIFSGWPARRQGGAKLILDLHDLMPEFFAARAEVGMDHPLVKMVTLQEQLSCRFADHVITVTEMWRQTIIERGVSAEKTSVVMNLADSRMFHRLPAGAEPSTNGFTKPEGFHVFYHGAIVQRYGLDYIIRAVANLMDELPDIHLTIHGRSEYIPTLEALTKELNATEHVHFSGEFLPMEDLPKLIRTADVAVVPYRYDIFTDGILPTKIMEYVAVGVPVVTVPTAGISGYFDDTMVEFVKQDDVEDLTNSLRKLYYNRDKLDELVENSDKFNQSYSWDKQKASYVELVQRLQAEVAKR